MLQYFLLSNINTFKDELISFEYQLDEHIDFLQDEIELKITSIKIELDDMCQSFKAELNDVKKKLKQYVDFVCHFIGH
jgi:hypothetical protein